MEGEPLGKTSPRPRAKIIRVESEFDPESKMVCCDQPTVQQQLNYELTINGERFRIPKVWASVCQIKPDKDIYFNPEVGNKIMDTIFRRQHPVEYKLSQLLDR